MDGEKGRRLNTNTNASENRDSSHNSPLPSSSHSREKNESSNPNEQHSKTIKTPTAVDSPESTRHTSDNPRESFKPTDSPPIQVMERTESSSGRWSDDSNDSLFSIHMGDDSFSKDVPMRLSGDICTSGELSLSEAYLPRLGESPPADKAVKGANEGVVDESNSEASISHTDSSRSSNPNASDNHDNKARNEAFVKALNGNPLCPCLCCGKMDCCCRWPSCKLAWPSCCAKLSWPSCCSKCSCSNPICSSCYNWNREPKRARSASNYSLMDKGVSGSTKHKTEP